MERVCESSRAAALLSLRAVHEGAGLQSGTKGKAGMRAEGRRRLNSFWFLLFSVPPGPEGKREKSVAALGDGVEVLTA